MNDLRAERPLIPLRTTGMNWDQIEGKWKQLTGRVRKKWGDLTDDDIEVIAGKREALCGKIQERYGINRRLAEEQLREFESELDRMS